MEIDFKKIESELKTLKNPINQILYDSEYKIVKNEGKDIKVDKDLELNAFLKEALFKIHKVPVYSEEDELSYRSFNRIKDEVYWLIDPLDGSFNFVNNIPHYNVSISLFKDNWPVLGFIYNPLEKELILGFNGNVTINSISYTLKTLDKKLNNSTLATGIPTYLQNQELANYWTLLIGLEKRVKKIRMFGSATDSIRLLIKGSIDHYYETKIAIWDVAAGIAICESLNLTVKTIFEDDYGSVYISSCKECLIGTRQLKN